MAQFVFAPMPLMFKFHLNGTVTHEPQRPSPGVVGVHGQSLHSVSADPPELETSLPFCDQRDVDIVAVFLMSYCY